MLRNLVFVLVLLILSVAVWIGASVYLNIASVDINPNAQAYTKSIPNSFIRDTFDRVVDRVDNKLRVSPEVFHALESEE